MVSGPTRPIFICFFCGIKRRSKGSLVVFASCSDMSHGGRMRFVQVVCESCESLVVVASHSNTSNGGRMIFVQTVCESCESLLEVA